MSSGAGASRLLRTAGLSSNHAIIRRNVMRKVKRGVDRLPSQGPDPAVTAKTPRGWQIAAAAVVERYPTVVPEPHPFEERYLRGRFIWQSSVARPAPEELFHSERDGVGGTRRACRRECAQSTCGACCAALQRRPCLSPSPPANS
jgi:hypothetical protein